MLENRLNRYLYLLKAMGIRYWMYRIYYAFIQKTLLLKWSFPTHQKKIIRLTKSEWMASSNHFFFESRISLPNAAYESNQLKEEAQQIFKGEIKYFNGAYFKTGEKDWLRDPKTGYHYPGHLHWSKIPDFIPGQDIKYVWEKSRFCYLFTIIRYDQHFNQDSSEFVISQIISWIDHAPVNCGPHYISSQEIALRIINWTFFLHFYKHSAALHEERFHKIINSIYAQTHHIAKNLNFSGMLVRNNHIVTESTALFTIGCIFSSLPGATKWVQQGRQIFEREIIYQVAEDGTYLQYSMNYNRVLIQLITWMLRLYELNKISTAPKLKEASIKTLEFLNTAMDQTNGMLPNYGANDGSLFFPLNDHPFRDYRPQLQALNRILDHDLNFEEQYEDLFWYNATPTKPAIHIQNEHTVLNQFTAGGYYILNEQTSQTFIRCGSCTFRPSQADNLHLDLWWEHMNIMRDAGTYQYNCEKELRDFYFGTVAHNTIQVGGYDQMLKGSRFIWYYWSKCKHASLVEKENEFVFSGAIEAFRQTGKWVQHERMIQKQKNIPMWTITDRVMEKGKLPITQIWNPSDVFFKHFTITSEDENGNIIEPIHRKGYFSDTYGIKQETTQILFSSSGSQIKTIIQAAH